MSKKSLDGKYGPGQKQSKKQRHREAAPLMPLDYALTRMRDESLAPELRDSMAKAALPFTHGRRETEAPPAPTPQEQVEQWSDLELARRIAHILMLADREEDEKNKSAVEKAPARVADAAQPKPERFIAQSPSQHHAQVSSHRVLPDEEDAPPFDPLDPHPGYRWIR